jgi:hypothetical protein
VFATRAAVKCDPFVRVMLMDPALEPLRYNSPVAAVASRGGLMRALGVSRAV